MLLCNVHGIRKKLNLGASLECGPTSIKCAVITVYLPTLDTSQ